MPCAGPRHLPKQGLPLASGSSLCGGPHLGPPAGCPELPAPCSPHPALLLARSSRHRLPPDQPTTASLCSPISVSADHSSPAPQLASLTPLKPLTGSQWSRPRVRGAGLVLGLVPEPGSPVCLAGSLDLAVLVQDMCTGTETPGCSSQRAWTVIRDCWPGCFHTQSPFSGFPVGKPSAEPTAPAPRREL